MRRAIARGWMVGALLGAVLGAGCGGSGDCGGFISVNASPEECMHLAEEFGCQHFEVNGPSCGLVACATCNAEPTPTPTASPTA